MTIGPDAQRCFDLLPKVFAMPTSISETLHRTDLILREAYDHLGFREGPDGAFLTGHVPHVAPFAYLCTRYPGLDDQGLQAAEEEAGRYLPEPYRALLAHMDGANILGITLQGAIGPLVGRSLHGIGQPISLRYSNVVERPAYIPAGSLGIGAINGPWYSQGHLYLASTGEVELYHSRLDRVGARWASLAIFLAEEIPRRMAFHDDRGHRLAGAKLLPGDTEDWEDLAKAARQQDEPRGIFARLKGLLRRR
ncbi:SMI1/KNR4 family protein [Stagnihabitans tardus]|uniref:Uncharacterized protein n=1 Tax=Stagnihabitans tardus TaxID=2699202 RepID=A0AAE5BVJ5_9RHOB|nr:SMI1/KNR4 family protein [Stagnihabitans tardus]NBZ87288.1 hypothetical protein [Stagnihabitans tardus]